MLYLSKLERRREGVVNRLKTKKGRTIKSKMPLSGKLLLNYYGGVKRQLDASLYATTDNVTKEYITLRSAVFDDTYDELKRKNEKLEKELKQFKDAESWRKNPERMGR